MFSALFSTLALAGALAAQTPTPAPAASAPKPARENGLYTTLQITHGGQPMGSIVMKMYETESPITVKNFVDLALGRKLWKDPKTGTRVRRPLYNGLTFHRVIPNFMIQGGDPTGTGMGETDVIKDEFAPTLKFDIPGRLAMANAGPGTGSCQFFITEVPTAHLNGKHTIFGQVVEGQDLVSRIARVPKMGDKPSPAVVIAKVTFERVGPVPPGGIVLAPVPAARPATKAPATKAPATKAPATKAPATKAPATKAPAKK
ncbi:peptidylprolyl isomerase [uncultured Paludibaculum sp.]|uniref:peptidylprolyl isomerase n=1 Tax=uncultured Paludibaculum sp. TaxID=1765020 RepID=UPI002AAB8CE5|nr:peptidylprolyl isomerase [uncultured Paludibaculum sp.]